MRKFSLMLMAAMLLAVVNVSANNPDPEVKKPVKELAARIGQLLKGQSTSKDFKGLTAHVRFMVNQEYEIVVLTVDTKNKEFEHLIKYKLNYKKVNLATTARGKTYIVPIRIGW